ncbi:thiosulfate oxidation carrier protein SoxY [Cognatishimia activa]|uniref:Sulfur oxidation protein SoxY n=1 Tax=Cognatishimia activa TaxID=1715691 RepID=A0A0P1IYG4_9RHOB|nr:thiosulfate oxidation carrier protein SoxY [Cognatishimia activa]CUI81272.1 sulfur oxidation protein SoxY [Cognatishimia activa]CUK26901.1 sulfur oxidation protein SoxY [Cognatishimia activa]
MTFSRRQVLAISGGAIAFAGLPAVPAFASLAEDAISEFTGGTAPGAGDLSISAPEIAENGNSVPIEFDAPGAVAVAIFADGNPTPKVGAFTFGPLSGSRFASTRIRLATTQNVIAIAQMEDGSFQRAEANVKVTIGGCGG